MANNPEHDDGLTRTSGRELAETGHETTHPVTAYLAGLSTRSRRTMLGALTTVAGLATDGQADAESFPWHLLRFQHTAAIRSALIEKYQNVSTINVHLAALRGVLKAAWRLGLMDGETYHRAADVPSARGSALPKGRSLGAAEIRALFGACAADTSPAGRRDAALLAVLYGAGLRRSEVAGLRLEDLDAESGALVVRGKGNQERTAYLAGGALAAIRDWLTVRGDDPGPLFLRIGKGGTIGKGGLSAQAIYGITRKRAEQAGVADFSPHDLRRTFVGDLLDAGADVSLVQKLAGHSQVTTTARYDRRPEKAKRRASELLFVPYAKAEPQVRTREGEDLGSA